jgi:hypothetical protein
MKVARSLLLQSHEQKIDNSSSAKCRVPQTRTAPA